MNLIVTKNNLKTFGETRDTDINIFIPDVVSFDDNDFAAYEIGLIMLANFVTAQYDEGNEIKVNVLTDIFASEPGTVDDKFLFCYLCPCWQCHATPKEFKAATGDEFIPPDQICRKSFIELRVSRYIAEQLKLPVELSDLNYEDYQEYVDLKFGSDLRRNNERFEQYKVQEEARKPV